MKDKKDLTFNIEVSTLRDLSDTEISHVAGGTSISLTPIIGPTTLFTPILTTGTGDEIFGDDFEEHP